MSFLTNYIFTNFLSEFNNFIFPCLVAGIFSCFLGFERQRREKAAGIRTHLMVSLGSCAFTLCSVYLAKQLGNNLGDASRMPAQIISGIGFLGAGVIMRDSNKIKGLTTASTIWVTSSIGVICGAKLYLLGFTVAIMSVLFLYLGRRLSRLVSAVNYNWKIDLEIISSSQEYNSLTIKNNLLLALEKAGYKIIHYVTDNKGKIILFLNLKKSASELSKTVKESLPSCSEYTLKIMAKNRSEVEESHYDSDQELE